MINRTENHLRFGNESTKYGSTSPLIRGFKGVGSTWLFTTTPSTLSRDIKEGLFVYRTAMTRPLFPPVSWSRGNSDILGDNPTLGGGARARGLHGS